jgi:outer membrane protein assembly factor BamB
MARLGARVLEIWRSWSVRRRLITVAVAGAVIVVAIGGAYLILKRPGDISKSGAEFRAHEKQQKEESVNWPMYGYDLERTRYLAAKGVGPPFHSRFLFDAHALLEFSPVYVDGTLYVMNKDAVFFGVDAGNGKVIWKHDQGELAAASAAYADGKLYITTLAPGQIICVRAKDGKRVWTRALPGRSEASPLVHNGKVFFGAESGDLFALDADTGHDVWHIDTAGSVKGGVAYHDGTVYVGDYAGHMYAVRASDGAIKWDTTDLGVGFGRSGRFYATPAVAFGRVYAGNADGRVYSFEASTGDIAWTRSTGGAVYASPAVADTPGTPPSVYIGSADHHVYALNADSGAEIWNADVGGLVSGSGSVVGDVVYVSDADNQTTKGYSIDDGELVYEVDKGQYNPVISDGRRIYLTGYAGITKLTPKEEGAGPGKGGAKKHHPGKPGGGGGPKKHHHKHGGKHHHKHKGGGKKQGKHHKHGHTGGHD